MDRNEKSEGYIVYKVPESAIKSEDVEVVADIVSLKHRVHERGYGRDCYNFKSYDKNPVWKL